MESDETEEASYDLLKQLLEEDYDKFDGEYNSVNSEIISNNNFYDYEAKYTKGISKHILPALVPPKIYDECLSNAKIVHDILRCKGVSKSDFLYEEKNNKLFFLEINTQPGLTPLSLVPEQLKFNNINFTIFIDKLLKSSL